MTQDEPKQVDTTKKETSTDPKWAKTSQNKAKRAKRRPILTQNNLKQVKMTQNKQKQSKKRRKPT